LEVWLLRRPPMVSAPSWGSSKPPSCSDSDSPAVAAAAGLPPLPSPGGLDRDADVWRHRLRRDHWQEAVEEEGCGLEAAAARRTATAAPPVARRCRVAAAKATVLRPGDPGACIRAARRCQRWRRRRQGRIGVSARRVLCWNSGLLVCSRTASFLSAHHFSSALAGSDKWLLT
jgi:hypothetical protein